MAGTTVSKGVPIGLKNVVYSLLTSDPESGEAVYVTPVSISGAISAQIQPNASNATLFADDGPYDTASTIGQISLSLNVVDLPPSVKSVLLGHTIDATTGVMVSKSDDVPPYVAIGFKALKSNGHYRYTWLMKGKFAAPEENNQTKGESINWNTPTITANFLKLDCDNSWKRQVDEDEPGSAGSTTIADWFKSPYAKAIV